MADNSTDTNAVVGGTFQTPVADTAGLETQVGGAATTVSAVAGATGGIAPGNLVEVDIDQKLFQFESDENVAMGIMLASPRVDVKSAVIQHYSIGESRPSVVTTAAVGTGATPQVVLPLAASDNSFLPAYTTVLVKGVDGYEPDGKTLTPGKDLMLFISGTDPVSNGPVARAVNGPKNAETDEECLVPAIAAGTTLIVMANAMFETQENVPPGLVVPQPKLLYAQKRGMTNVVSDYFEAQAKRIPFSKALIAEAQIRDFKVKGNRTLWGGRPGKLVVNTELGPQTIYFTEGLRWMINRHLDKNGKWSFEELITLTKMVFTGTDVPKHAMLIGGKNFIENIQTIDFSKHPEVKISVETNALGWKVTSIHSIFGSLEIKHEPTLDRMGWSNSGAVIAYDRTVHYVYSQEHKNKSKVDGHEAQRESTVVWDALGLKGNCHIWINGEDGADSTGSQTYVLWDSSEAPENPVEGKVYVLVNDCAGIDAAALKGTMWTCGNGAWKEFTGELNP